MRLKVTISQMIIVALIFILLIGVIFQNVLASPITDGAEGTWYDTFDDVTGLTLVDSVLENGAIECKKGMSDSDQYTFSDKYNHYAYAYSRLFFLPMNPITSLYQETLFDAKMNDSIKGIDSKYAPWSATWLKKVVQHFRFQMRSTADVIDKINVIWYGKATDKTIVKYYFWNSSKFTVGAWQFLGMKYGENNLTINVNITHGDIKHALDTNRYFDFCVVASPNFATLSQISLSTNFIKLISVGEKGYRIGEGSAETKNPIIPKDISSHFNKFHWEVLTWDDYQTTGATIRYQLLYENGTNKYVPVPNKYFLNNPGGNNSYGFSQPPIYLNAIPFENFSKLKIRATLNTTSTDVTPRIYNWAITWQNWSQWHDSFNNSYRVDKKNKVVIVNGLVNLSKIQGEWPVFGFNSENNRATTVLGPSTSNLNWYSSENNDSVGGGFRNPVIGAGNVYIFSDNNKLYQYNMKLPSGASSGSAQAPTLYHVFDYDIVNSPAITEDYIIIATGQMAQGGQINHIYAIPKDNISKPPAWDYKNNNIPICYNSSPVVAGDRIFITSWGGDNGVYTLEKNRYTNNKLLCIDLKNENKTWQKELPGPSFSTPAVSLSSNIVIAGCDSTNNESLFAYTLDGTKIWGKKIDAVGYASPVIYKSVVFVITTSSSLFSFKTNIYALNLVNGEFLWNKTICESVLEYDHIGDSTPAIYDDILFVASPDGTIFAFHALNGTQLWSTPVYNRPLTPLSQTMISSPVYANGNIYIGTPSLNEAEIIALNAVTGKKIWSFNTFHKSGVNERSPILGSPIISNGLLFVTDENGNLYSIGNYKAPSEQITGSITSLPIKLPESFKWYRFNEYSVYNKTISSINFKLLDENNNVRRVLTNGTILSETTLPLTLRLFAEFTTKNITADNPSLLRWEITYTSKDSAPPYLYPTTTPKFNGTVVPKIIIKVKDNQTGLLNNSAKYTLRYILNNKTYTNTYSAQCTGKNGTTQVQNITANLSKISNFNNIKSLVYLNFSIKDLAENEVTRSFSIDTTSPYLYPTTTPLFNGTVVPKIIIKVKDDQTGLRVNSAEYILRYIFNNTTYTNAYSAQCTGMNGTTKVENITANLSAIPIFKNITSFVSIQFSIEDLAGNKATKIFTKPETDTTLPSSHIINLSITRFNSSVNFIAINAVSFDNGTDASGIQQVILFYRYSQTQTFTGDWIYFANSSQKSPQWKFNITNNPNQHGGYFEACTVAIDKANNTEKLPTKGDISFIYDWMKPNLPSVSGDTLWLKERSISSVNFEDDFRLDTIEYRPNFENSWATIATDINAITYDKSWSLKEEYWDIMNEGEVYYLYFKINDTLGNTLLVTSNSQAITFRKDTSVPIATLDIPSLDTDTSWSHNFTINGYVNDQDGSGIKEVLLYYRFSKDKSNWINWTIFGDILKSPPFEWNYSAVDGEGYYEFKIKATDIAGNTMESDVLPITIVTSFPQILILVMISLVIVLSLLSVIIFIKWKNTKVR